MVNPYQSPRTPPNGDLPIIPLWVWVVLFVFGPVIAVRAWEILGPLAGWAMGMRTFDEFDDRDFRNFYLRVTAAWLSGTIAWFIVGAAIGWMIFG